MLVVRPSRAEFADVPFSEYVAGVLKAHPGVPCFKVGADRSSSHPRCKSYPPPPPGRVSRPQPDLCLAPPSEAQSHTQVVPPKGWSPRTSPMPSLDDVHIGTPIKQHVRPARLEHSRL